MGERGGVRNRERSYPPKNFRISLICFHFFLRYNDAFYKQEEIDVLLIFDKYLGRGK